MPWRSIVLKPVSDAFTVYVPGSTFEKLYSPLSLVTAERLMLVASLVIETSTPGTTPLASLTAPRRPPWNPWLHAVADTAINRMRSRATRPVVTLMEYLAGRTEATDYA